MDLPRTLGRSSKVRRDKSDSWLDSSTVVGEVELDCAESASWVSWNKRLRFLVEGGGTYPSLAGRKRLEEDDYSTE